MAALIARGLTNREIAAALIITERTAGTHVEHILNKLGQRNRAQITAWAVGHGLVGPAGAAPVPQDAPVPGRGARAGGA